MSGGLVQKTKQQERKMVPSAQNLPQIALEFGK
jgi:hypothetical protein